jgi:small subunit ribosomal protein S10e
MLVPKNVRRQIYQRLLQDGVMVAHKDFNAPRHCNLPVKNLYVIKLMQSLRSRELVRENFSWMWFYWYLTEEGIEYLRDYLHVPDTVVPATMKKPKTTARAPGASSSDSGPRRSYGGGDKKAGAPGSFEPGFRGDRYGGRGGSGGAGRGYRSDRFSGASSDRFGQRSGGFGRGSGAPAQ